jgi:anti-sigma B factor antagonist
VSTYRHFDVRIEGDVVVVAFAKRQIRDDLVIAETATELCSVADRVQQKPLVLDFAGVVDVSSMMLGKLVTLQAKIKKNRGDLRLRNVGPEVRQVLATTKLDQMFRLEQDQPHVLHTLA